MGYTEGLILKIHTNKYKKRETIEIPHAQREYVTYYNNVDKNNHEISFCLMTIWTIHHCLRIFFWALDRIFHTLFVVVLYLVKSGIGKSKWRKEE